MGIANPRPAMRSREIRKIEVRLRMHAQFMRALEAEGWDREAASAEAYLMLKKIEKTNADRK